MSYAFWPLESVKSSAIRKCWSHLMCPDNDLLQELTSTEAFATEELNNWISENNVESAPVFTHLKDENNRTFKRIPKC